MYNYWNETCIVELEIKLYLIAVKSIEHTGVRASGKLSEWYIVCVPVYKQYYRYKRLYEDVFCRHVLVVCGHKMHTIPEL